MTFDKFELTLGTVIFGLLITLIVLVAGFVGSESWRASEKAAAYRAYTDCLSQMKNEPIDVKQMFCGKIRDQL